MSYVDATLSCSKIVLLASIVSTEMQSLRTLKPKIQGRPTPNMLLYIDGTQHHSSEDEIFQYRRGGKFGIEEHATIAVSRGSMGEEKCILQEMLQPVPPLLEEPRTKPRDYRLARQFRQHRLCVRKCFDEVRSKAIELGIPVNRVRRLLVLVHTPALFTSFLCLACHL